MENTITKKRKTKGKQQPAEKVVKITGIIKEIKDVVISFD